MKAPQHEQVAIYTDASAIPRHQRAWVWGTVALVILLCGAAAGWLLARSVSSVDPASGANTTAVAGNESIAQQAAINAQLRQQITQLERALAGDPCGPMAEEALAPGAGKH